MSFTDGFSPHRWTSGIGGQSADSLSAGIGGYTTYAKRKKKKRK